MFITSGPDFENELAGKVGFCSGTQVLLHHDVKVKKKNIKGQ